VPEKITLDDLMENEQATAYHEAGHAFADWHFNFRVKRASIVANKKDNSAGHVLTKTGLPFRSLEHTSPSGARIGRFHDHVVSLLAGQAAQRRYRQSSVRSYHAVSDRNAIADILFTLHSTGELPHVIRYLEAKARNLIECPMHWFVIQYLAEELLRRKTMTGEEVETTIREGFDLHQRSRLEKRENKSQPKRQRENAHER